MINENIPREYFIASYVGAALWSSIDDNGEPLDYDRDEFDIDPDTLEALRATAGAFYDANAAHIHCEGAPLASDCPDASTAKREAAQAGHDAWLNANGHGAGFCDGDWPEPAASVLDAAARAMGETFLYVGDDGMIHA